MEDDAAEKIRGALPAGLPRRLALRSSGLDVRMTDFTSRERLERGFDILTRPTRDNTRIV